ncbi:hypothetical protein C8Q74DRAFT_1450511 [Fomes fomentarius]|nr:hypothetical protein C8Q74DRAFT_1450511 [Fomes fomentarius]
MLEWSPENLEKIQSSQITVLPAYRAYFRRRNLADLTLEEDGSILFDHSTIGAWVRSLAKLLGHADELSDPTLQQGDTLLRLSDTLMVIDFFLHQKAVKFAFAGTSLAYRFSFGYLGQDDDAYDEFFSGRVVINALRKTTAPRVSIVHLGHGLNTFETNRDTIGNELQSRIMELSGVASDIVSDWLSLDLRVRNVTVHAEAGLMALAYYVKHNEAKAKGQLPENLVEMFMAMDVPRSELARDAATCATGYGRSSSVLETRQVRVVFSPTDPSYMPKTHGRIVPWDPPRFGIPDEIMRRLSDVLEKEAVRHACAKEERARELEYERQMDEKWASLSDEGDLGCLSEYWAALDAL